MNKTRFSELLLRPFPQLVPLREIYCSKDKVDQATHFLEEQGPELLLKLVREEGAVRLIDYLEALSSIRKYLQEEASYVLPYTLIGMIDLSYEISRRARKAYDLPDVPPQGRGLAASPEGPFPMLINLPIDAQSAQRGANQEMIDTALTTFYERRPDIWFLLAESVRHHVGIRPEENLMREIVLEKGFASDVKNKYVEKGDLWSITNACKTEMGRRLYQMCDLSDTNFKILVEPHRYSTYQ